MINEPKNNPEFEDEDDDLLADDLDDIEVIDSDEDTDEIDEDEIEAVEFEDDYELFDEDTGTHEQIEMVPVYRAPTEHVGYSLVKILQENNYLVDIRQLEGPVNQATKRTIRSRDFWGEILVPAPDAQQALSLITKYLDVVENAERMSVGEDFLPHQIISGRMPHVNI